jgi:hypothetical protein
VGEELGLWAGGRLMRRWCDGGEVGLGGILDLLCLQPVSSNR